MNSTADSPTGHTDVAHAADRARPADFVQSLERGLAVLRAFGAERGSLTIAEVAQHTGLTRAAARRFLHTLVALEYVATDGKQYRLRPRVLELGYAYLSDLGLPELAQPHLRALSEATGESTSLAVLDGTDIVYVARVAAYRLMSVALGVGARFPALVTSLGRAILAFAPDAQREAVLAGTRLHALTPHTVTDPAALRGILTRTREDGWAVVDQELELGLRSVAVPVRDASGAVVAAVNVSTPVGRGSFADIETALVAPLRTAAARIETDLTRAGLRLT